jgi:Tol biopolymer transport system component
MLALFLGAIGSAAEARTQAAENGLFEIRVDGQDRRLLIDLAGRQLYDLSPDRKLALVNDGPRSLAIATIGRPGIRTLGTAPYQVERASWSRNGKLIAFELADLSPCRPGATACAEWQVWLVGANGVGLRRFSRWSRFAAWSPDSRRLAFAGSYSTYEEAGRITIARVAGRGRRQIGPPRPAFYLTWARRGGNLAFGGSGQREGTIRVIRVSDGRTRNYGQGVQPEWSPNGRRLAYVRTFGSRGLYVIRPAVRQGYRVAEGRIGDVAWSPNGKKLAYVLWRDGDSQIYVQSIDSRIPPKQATHEASGRRIDQIFWSRDGTRLLYESGPIR